MEEFEENNEDRAPVKLDFSKRASRNFGSGKKSLLANRNQRAVKLRLLSLVGLLLLVVVAMKEAGKPERWMWLGFDQPSSSKFVTDRDISADDIVLQAQRVAADDRGEHDDQNSQLGRMTDSVAEQLAESKSRLGGQAESDVASRDSQQTQDPQQTPEAKDFWRSTFLKLNDSQQEAFYELLRRIDASKIQLPRDQAKIPFDATIKKLITLQENNQAKVLGLIAGISTSDRKTKQTETMFAFDESWQQHVLPALRASAAGEDFTVADQAAIRSVRSIIDPIVMQDVEDLTGIGNPRDKLAWRAVWDFAQRDGRSPQNIGNTHTTLLQLTGQPEAFRGQPVSISGTALTIRRKNLDQTRLNLDHYFELWLDPPSQINDGLVCVYAASLPRGFESAIGEVSEQFRTIKVPVTVDGRFFKIRSYQDAGKSVSHCPVVVAGNFKAEFQPAISPAAASWRPSTAVVIAFFVLSAIAATAIACVVYQSTQSGSYIIKKTTPNRVARSLDALTDDETVMTDAQRVQQLNDQLEEDFS